MLAVIDYRTDKNTLTELSKYVDDIYLFRTEGITYNSVSGHPDIFIFQNYNNLIIAPNSPPSLFDILKKYEVKYTIGKISVGKSLIESVAYNCLSTKNYLFHKKTMTEKTILEAGRNLKFINLNQAYTRCSLISLKDDIFLTSDKGVEKIINKHKLKCFYFDPAEITIIDHKNGFIGGTAGVNENKIFFNGNINLHKDGKFLTNAINSLGMDIINLGNHRLYDGGGIFFIS